MRASCLVPGPLIHASQLGESIMFTQARAMALERVFSRAPRLLNSPLVVDLALVRDAPTMHNGAANTWRDFTSRLARVPSQVGVLEARADLRRRARSPSESAETRRALARPCTDGMQWPQGRGSGGYGQLPRTGPTRTVVGRTEYRGQGRVRPSRSTADTAEAMASADHNQYPGPNPAKRSQAQQAGTARKGTGKAARRRRAMEAKAALELAVGYGRPGPPVHTHAGTVKKAWPEGALRADPRPRDDRGNDWRAAVET
jgi:hypothetical protein